MRWLVAIVLLLAAGTADAQPVQFQLQGEVAVGHKPQIRIMAVEQVSEIRIDLDRDDGKHFTLSHGALAKGKSVALSIGDGAAGTASYKGTIRVKAGSGGWSDQLVFDTAVRAPIKVSYDAAHLDLDNRQLQFKVSRAIDRADLVVIGEDGTELGKGTATYKAAALDTWLAVRWTQPADTRAMVIKLRVSASDGVATNVELIPWSLIVDHDDVNFSTDSAVIEASETAKLDASLHKITDAVKRGEKFMKLQLYVAGHTDTVGNNAKNRKLSVDRASAIGTYFRKHGLAVPIAVAGYGEEVLKVKTAQNVDERANRRVDYVLGPAGGAPPFKGPYTKVRVGWKQLR